jgi:Gpi18-like mannosyltransferase
MRPTDKAPGPGTDAVIGAGTARKRFRQLLARLKAPDIAIPVGWFLASRLTLTALGVLLWQLHLIPTSPDPALRPYFGYPPSVGPWSGPLLGVWERFDAIHYLRIASGGIAEPPLTAFPPLYPLLTRALGLLLGGRWTLSGLIVSGAASLLAFVFLFRLIRRLTPDEGMAQRALAYTAFFPTAFFLAAPYPEALLLLFSVLTLDLAQRGRWLGAFVCGLAAGAARSQGIALVLPVAAMAFEEPRHKRPWVPFVSASGAAGGVLLSLAWRWSAGFPPMTQVQAEYWGRVVAIPWQGLVQPMEYFDLAVVLLMVVLACLGLRRLPAAYSLYFWAGIAANLSTIRLAQPMASQARYAAVVFPAFIVLGGLGRRPWLHRLILYFSFATFLFLAGQYMMGGWVG